MSFHVTQSFCRGALAEFVCSCRSAELTFNFSLVVKAMAIKLPDSSLKLQCDKSRYTRLAVMFKPSAIFSNPSYPILSRSHFEFFFYRIEVKID